MRFFKQLFEQNKQTKIQTNADFWRWFTENKKTFFKAVQKNTEIENDFFDKLTPKLNELKSGYFFLTGMLNEQTAELIITPDGDVKNVVFVEELIKAAPKIEGWRFTALKPALDIDQVGIEMGGYKFNKKNLSFYANDDPKYPDVIDIVIVHDDLNGDNQSEIISGTYMFLDNYLGELNFIEIIDELNYKEKKDLDTPLIPIDKLKDYLIWRQKEFIEKYDGVRTNSDSDSVSVLEAELETGRKLIATINTDLLKWDRKASHPWILAIEIKYDGEANRGLPDDTDYKRLNVLEDELFEELIDSEGYLYIGRQTSNNTRDIFFACKDFRKPSLVTYQWQERHKSTDDISYTIFKDKYWQSFNQFIPPA